MVNIGNNFRQINMVKGIGSNPLMPVVKIQGVAVTAANFRVRSKINSQNWRSDLGQIWLLRLSEATGIASYFEDFAIEQRPNMA
jgi:hypothetical protein